MGQAKLRLKRALEKQPYCVFCGGTTLATSVDHCPPKSIFDGNRPKGLEFPQCEECREGTRSIDAIMGMFSRIYPDPETEEGRKASHKHIVGFINNHPELAASFVYGDEKPVLYRGKEAYPIRLGENEAMHRVALAFAARLGLGLYFDATGKAVPPDWWVVCRWYTNHQLDQDADLEQLLRSIGAPRTLAMGRNAVPNEFRYWAGTASDVPDQFLCFAAFRESFGVTAIVGPPDDTHGDLNPAVFRPGFLKGFRP